METHTMTQLKMIHYMANSTVTVLIQQTYMDSNL